MTIIFGHKNPDTDSIVSALVYADMKGKMGEKAKPCRLGPLNNETKFVLSFFKQKPPALIKNVAGKQVILIDHADSSKSAPGLDKAEVIEIIDHHYIGDIRTIKPILYRAEPLGSTTTILAKIAKEKSIKLNKKQAGLLLAGIVSDTFCFTSPTTTQEDIKIGKELAKISGIKAKELAEKMFEAKSDIKGMTVQDILSEDCKRYIFGGKKLDISVVETVDTKIIKSLNSKIFKELKKIKKQKKPDLLFFLAVDILKARAFLYLIGSKEKQVAEKVFGGEIEKNIMWLPGVVSRKKQVVPPLAEYLKKSAVEKPSRQKNNGH